MIGRNYRWWSILELSLKIKPVLQTKWVEKVRLRAYPNLPSRFHSIKRIQLVSGWINKYEREENAAALKTFKGRFTRRSTDVQNQIDELSPAKEERLNQISTVILFGAARIGKFDRACHITRHW